MLVSTYFEKALGDELIQIGHNSTKIQICLIDDFGLVYAFFLTRGKNLRDNLVFASSFGHLKISQYLK
jgi:hypothetical protein